MLLKKQPSEDTMLWKLKLCHRKAHQLCTKEKYKAVWIEMSETEICFTTAGQMVDIKSPSN